MLWPFRPIRPITKYIHDNQNKIDQLNIFLAYNWLLLLVLFFYFLFFIVIIMIIIIINNRNCVQYGNYKGMKYKNNVNRSHKMA